MAKQSAFLSLFGGNSKEERIGGEEAQARTLTAFLKNEKGQEKQLSFLFLKEANWIATILKISNDTKMPCMTDFMENVLKLRVSHNRLGRAEIVEVIKARQAELQSRREQYALANELKTKLGVN